VIPGEPSFPKAQFPRLPSNGLRLILAVWRARRLEITRNGGGVDERLIEFIVPLAVCDRLFAVDTPYPLAVGGLLDILGLLGIHSAVKAHVSFPLANARYGTQVFSNGDLDIGIPMFSTWPSNNVIDSFSHWCSSRSKL